MQVEKKMIFSPLAGGLTANSHPIPKEQFIASESTLNYHTCLFCSFHFHSKKPICFYSMLFLVIDQNNLLHKLQRAHQIGKR